MSDEGRNLREALLGDLVGTLDLVILERLPGGVLFRLGDQAPPPWFSGTFHAAHGSKEVTLIEAFPMLDDFLSQAEIFWERDADGRLEGDVSVMITGDGENLPLATVAVSKDGRKFLLLQRVPGFDERQNVLQRARERALEHEQVVKRIDQLQHPLTTLSKLVGELGAMELGQPQRKHLDRIAEEVHTLRQVVDELPRLPKGTSAKTRR